MPSSNADASPVFATTHWSVVLMAGRNDTERARAALAKLCRTYWYPLYAYARRRGQTAHDAQDLTQEFFVRLLERRLLAAADPDRGRFRSFILTAMKNFLASEWRKTQARKRGGEEEIISLDWAAAEQKFGLEPAVADAPDNIFDRQWAMALLDAAIVQLEEEYRRDGKAELFSTLRATLIGGREEQPYAVLAVKLDMNESAVKVAVHRLRKRYRLALRAEIAQTVATEQEVDEEMRDLFKSLTGA